MSMTESYRRITPELARKIRLVVTDVDGTITSGGDSFSSTVLEAIRCLQEQSIMVGLASGRTLPRLESVARDLCIGGPIIAENGGVARVKKQGALIDLGYSREPAIKALEKLKTLFPRAIREREDNKDRLVDIAFHSHEVEKEQLRKHLKDIQLLDSGYMLHLLQDGVSKGKTLERLLGKMQDGRLSPDNVMVFGDSATDISLFKLFPHSVLVTNPELPEEQTKVLRNLAKYESDLLYGDGFAEVSFHILNARAYGV